MDDLLYVDLCNHGTFELTRDPRCPCPDPTERGGRLESLQAIKGFNDDVVYRATWTDRTHSEEDPSSHVDVVLKLHFCVNSPPNELEHEAAMYHHARANQGSVIPWCYGLFRGSPKNAPEDEILVLLLEYCGEPLTNAKNELISFLNLDRDKQRLMVRQTLALHHIGKIQHNDLYPRNVVWTEDGEPVIVDLAHASEHECQRRMDAVENTACPSILDFGCNELYDICLECRVWLPVEMHFAGEVIWAHTIHTMDDILEPIKKTGRRITPQRMKEAQQILEAIQFRRKYYPDSLQRSHRSQGGGSQQPVT